MRQQRLNDAEFRQQMFRIRRNRELTCKPLTCRLDAIVWPILDGGGTDALHLWHAPTQSVRVVNTWAELATCDKLDWPTTAELNRAERERANRKIPASLTAHVGRFFQVSGQGAEAAEPRG